MYVLLFLSCSSVVDKFVFIIFLMLGLVVRAVCVLHFNARLCNKKIMLGQFAGRCVE